MNATRFSTEQRRHFALAFDRLKLVKLVLGMGEHPAYGFVPAAFAASLDYTPVPSLPHDAIVAHQYFEEHPIARTLRAVYNSSDLHTPIAVFFQAEMDKIGVPVLVENMDFRVMLDMASREHDFDFLRHAWCADYPDPYDFLKIFVTGHENNYGEYSHPAFDAVMAQIEVEPDRDRRNALLHQAEALLAQDPPAIPMYFYKLQYLLSPTFSGLRLNQTMDFLWEHLRSTAAE